MKRYVAKTRTKEEYKREMNRKKVKNMKVYIKMLKSKAL